MTELPTPTQRRRRRIGVVLRFFGIRVVVWGGVAVLVYLLLGDVRSMVAPRPSSPQVTGEPEPGALEDPGWPHLRGPHYNGLSDETGLPDAWPPDGPPVLWTRELGQGYSAFTAVDGRVVTQTQSTYSQSVLCLDAETGDEIWEHRYGWPYDAASLYPGPRATPTWHGGRVYFAGPRGLVGCLAARDGRLLWSVNVIEKYGGRGSDFGYSCSPLVEQGMVILPVGGPGAGLVALDTRDGSTVWSSGDEPASYCSAIPITVGRRRHVVAFLRNALVSADLETGRPLWQLDYSSGYDEHAAFPLYEEPYLMVSGPFRAGSEMVRIELEEPASGDAQAPGAGPPGVSVTRVWFSRRMSNDVASSVLVDGHVYGFDLRDVQSKAHRPSKGKFTCMKLATGEVLWTTERTGHASVIAADGKLILLNDTGEVLLVRARPDRYEELARAKVFGDEICWTAPALDRGRLYVRSPSRGACLYLGRPEGLARQRLVAARRVSEIAESKRLDPARLLGGEREYPADRPTGRELGVWYGASLVGVLGVAAALGALAYVVMRMLRPAGARPLSRVVFWAALFPLGVAATPVFNGLGEEFVFTWPAGLFAAHQITLIAVFGSHRPDRGRGSWWAPAAAGLGLLAACLGYFHLCRVLGLAMEWVFLLGFLPSWPVAIPAALRLCRNRRLLEDLLWAFLSFSLYYWACGGYLTWAAR